MSNTGGPLVTPDKVVCRIALIDGMVDFGTSVTSKPTGAVPLVSIARAIPKAIAFMTKGWSEPGRSNKSKIVQVATEYRPNESESGGSSNREEPSGNPRCSLARVIREMNPRVSTVLLYRTFVGVGITCHP